MSIHEYYFNNLNMVQKVHPKQISKTIASIYTLKMKG